MCANYMENIITLENIVLNAESEAHEDAIRRCGQLLVDGGYVNERYIEGMIARNRNFTTAIGNCIAIPHGEKEYKEEIIKTGLAVITYPNGLDWDGEKVHLVIGIAAKGNEHLEILENIVERLDDSEQVLALVNANDKQAIYDLLTR